MLVIKWLLPEAFVVAGGSVMIVVVRDYLFLFISLLIPRMNKITKQLGTAEVAETLMSDRPWRSYFSLAYFCVKLGWKCLL